MSQHRIRHALFAALFLGLAFSAHSESEWPLRGLPDEAQLAYQSITEADVFSFGPIGFGAITSNGELAMRILTRYPNAVEIFKLVAVQASPEGKLYALTALHALDAEGYRWALEGKPEGMRVFLQAACAGRKEPVADVLERVEAGEYDKYVPRQK